MSDGILSRFLKIKFVNSWKNFLVITKSCYERKFQYTTAQRGWKVKKNEHEEKKSVMLRAKLFWLRTML